MKMKLIALLFLQGATTLTAVAQDKLYADQYPLGSVTLLDGPFKTACDLNVEVLLKYDTDRLLAPYLKEAGLEAKAESFENWIGLDGHVGGHYLTALAMAYAATGNAQCKERMDYMVSELKRCQATYAGTANEGYCGGVPDGLSTIFDVLRRNDMSAAWGGWVPWYNIHKTYAGLRDAWIYGGNADAKDIFLKLCDWTLGVIDPITDENMEAMLGNEHGGMDEVLADAYAISGDIKYLNAAERFRHRWLYDSMLAGVDNLDNVHANTQVPKVVGYARIAELNALAGETADAADFQKAAHFFWQTVTQNRSLAIGGNSRREHFPSVEGCQEYADEVQGPESCNTNNMLKLTGDLFRMNPSAAYADFYERAMLNHILSTQHPEHGGYVYFTPARPAHYRVYSDVNQAMWCCVGTGMENHSKYGEFIYTKDGDGLRVNLFIASKLDWADKGITLTQQTAFPDAETSTITVNTAAATATKISVRYPGWCEPGTMKCLVGGTDYAAGATPGSYIEISRTWSDGDIIELTMPMPVTVEEMPNVSNYIAVMRGPVVLAARMGTDGVTGLVADDGRWSHISPGPKVSVFDTPIMLGSREEVIAKLKQMKPVEGKSLTYTVDGLFMDAAASATEVSEGRFANVQFEPFFRIHDERYMMYWLQMTEDDYAAYKDELKAEEDVKLALEARTIDQVATGEQQPEVDHQMESLNSGKGVHENQAYRDCGSGGYFQYTLNTQGTADPMELMVRYWGNDGGNRTFDILVDGTVIATENIVNKWNKNEFVEVVYKIPHALTEGKQTIDVRFQPHDGHMAGGVFYLRLLKSEVIPADKLLPLSDINPSIYAEGTYDAATQTLVTGQYGFGGWYFAEGIDLSAYKNLVVELQEKQTVGASFRIYDENTYWCEPAMYDFGDATQLTIPLHSMTKKVGEGTAPVDPSHLYYLGWWSYGGSPIKIKSVSVEKDPSTAIHSLPSTAATPRDNAYYNIMGQKLSQRPHSGLYIHNGRLHIAR